MCCVFCGWTWESDSRSVSHVAPAEHTSLQSTGCQSGLWCLLPAQEQLQRVRSPSSSIFCCCWRHQGGSCAVLLSTELHFDFNSACSSTGKLSLYMSCFHVRFSNVLVIVLEISERWAVQIISRKKKKEKRLYPSCHSFFCLAVERSCFFWNTEW